MSRTIGFTGKAPTGARSAPDGGNGNATRPDATLTDVIAELRRRIGAATITHTVQYRVTVLGNAERPLGVTGQLVTTTPDGERVETMDTRDMLALISTMTATLYQMTAAARGEPVQPVSPSPSATTGGVDDRAGYL